MTDIHQLLPHRRPFLYVDRLLTVHAQGGTGEKTFGVNEYFFAGHFPQFPIVPGVILVESLAQCGGAIARELGHIGENDLFFLATIDDVKFRRPVHPEYTVQLEIVNEKMSSVMIRQSGKVYIDGVTAAEARWMCIVQNTSP
jgi:3-hydroxyacyl-[acyl-carrier-protein] dehydratase